MCCNHSMCRGLSFVGRLYWKRCVCTPLRHEEEQEGEKEEEENKIIGKESKMIEVPSSLPLPLPLLSFVFFYFILCLRFHLANCLRPFPCFIQTLWVTNAKVVKRKVNVEKADKIPNYYLCVCYLMMESHWNCMPLVIKLLRRVKWQLEESKKRIHHIICRFQWDCYREMAWTHNVTRDTSMKWSKWISQTNC